MTRGEEGHRDAGTRGRQSRAVTRTPGLALSVLGTHVNLAFLKTLGNTGTGASTFFTEGPQVLSGGGPVCTRGRSCGASSPPLSIASEEAPDGGDTSAECCPVPTGSASLRGRCVPAEGPLTAAAPALQRTRGSVPSPGAGDRASGRGPPEPRTPSAATCPQGRPRLKERAPPGATSSSRRRPHQGWSAREQKGPAAVSYALSPSPSRLLQKPDPRP